MDEKLETIESPPDIKRRVETFVELPSETTSIFIDHVRRLIDKRGYKGEVYDLSKNGDETKKVKHIQGIVDPRDHMFIRASIDSKGVIETVCGSALRRKKKEDIFPAENFTFFPDGRIKYIGFQVTEPSDDIVDRFNQFTTNFERIERYSSRPQRFYSMARRIIDLSLFTKEQ
jgi:serine/threonine-protein kinase RIO1